jgi:excisionase family DNA binding protein
MDELIDVEAVARRLGVTVRFVRRLVFERRIAYVKVGRHVRFEPAVVERWIAEARQDAEQVG